VPTLRCVESLVLLVERFSSTLEEVTMRRLAVPKMHKIILVMLINIFCNYVTCCWLLFATKDG
jgi:hypothetical protein